MMEKERDTRCEQDSQGLETLRTELEWKLQCLEPREKTVEAMVAKVKFLTPPPAHPYKL